MYFTSDMKLSVVEIEKKCVFYDVETEFKNC